MPITTYEKSATPRSLVYDAGQILQLSCYPTTNAAITTIQSLIVLPVSVKIYGAAICGLNVATNGILTFNVVLGSGAETGSPVADNSEAVGWPPTVAQAGAQLFATDQPLATFTNGTVYSYATSIPDAIWPKGSTLTLRLTTGASAGGQLFVSLFAKAFDTQPQSPGKFNRTLAYADM